MKVLHIFALTTDQATSWRPAIRLFHVHFDAKRCLATLQYVGFRLMDSMPIHLDIAGGYIVAVENSKWPYDAGDVRLIRWADMKALPLPPVRPRMRMPWPFV